MRTTDLIRTTPPDDGSRAPYGPWAAAWTGMAALATANGIARGLYAGRLGEQRAHQVSTVTLIAVLLPYARAVERRAPIPTARSAVGIGAAWLGLTVGFEFGFGHYVGKQSWSSLRADYDLPHGRLWPLVLLAVGTAPAAARRLRRG
jgi:hypothetical protein